MRDCIYLHIFFKSLYIYIYIYIHITSFLFVMNSETKWKWSEMKSKKYNTVNKYLYCNNLWMFWNTQHTQNPNRKFELLGSWFHNCNILRSKMMHDINQYSGVSTHQSSNHSKSSGGNNFIKRFDIYTKVNLYLLIYVT